EDKNYFLISCKNFFKEEKFIRADIYNPPFLFQSEAFVPRMASTHILRLQGDSYEIPNRRMKKYIRHAQKTDIKIAPLDDEKYLDGFYRLVLLTARRHKTKPRYSKKFFQRLYRISREDSRVIWPMVVYENSIVASHIYFVERSQILDWQSCCDQDNRLRPNYLLYDYIIKLAISRGIKELNLGGTPPEADSLMEFKERWGGMKIAYPYYTYLSNIGKLIYRGHRA
ncbi:MAG: GNAT family N-acetyltransferase, partial [candidate division Zixibacteria bacterium]|nr:GNAT family N-acetyltransferase [candidate division Zixibacteria bacterium]